MITNPNTLGLFERDIPEIAKRLHDVGGLVYIDGANMNAILGITRPGDFGGDMMHYNVHKTFTGPHGAGGPGAGPIAVRDFLADYLPGPIVTRNPKSEIRNPKEAESTKSEIQKPGDGGELEFRISTPPPIHSRRPRDPSVACEASSATSASCSAGISTCAHWAPRVAGRFRKTPSSTPTTSRRS
jgi:hypothetical protein